MSICFLLPPVFCLGQAIPPPGGRPLELHDNSRQFTLICGSFLRALHESKTKPDMSVKIIRLYHSFGSQQYESSRSSFKIV